MEQTDGLPNQSSPVNPTSSIESPSDLLALVNSCNDVDEFRNMLQVRGIWLNRKAAASAFHSLRSIDDESLDDEALAAVTGGVSAHGNDSSVIEAVLRMLTMSPS